jgi:hypothetical protein
VTTPRTSPLDLGGHTVDARLASPQLGRRPRLPQPEPVPGSRGVSVVSSLEDGDPSGAPDDRRESVVGQNRYGCFALVLGWPERLAKELARQRDHSLKPRRLAETAGHSERSSGVRSTGIPATYAVMTQEEGS